MGDRQSAVSAALTGNPHPPRGRLETTPCPDRVEGCQHGRCTADCEWAGVSVPGMWWDLETMWAGHPCISANFTEWSGSTWASWPGAR